MKKMIQTYPLGDMIVAYVEETDNKSCGMLLYPAAMEKEVCLEGNWRVDSLVQVKIVGDAYPTGFSHGHTMRNSQTVEKLRFVKQTSHMENSADTGEIKIIETVLESDELRVVHKLAHLKDMPYVSVETILTNLMEESVKLEMLSSYSICGLSPFGQGERMEDMNLYRLRSKWSAEGRLTKESFLSLQMEPSWQRCVAQSIRFGEVGSMPVREFFPWAAVEDERYHVLTGAQLYHNGSWQMEVYGRDDRAALSGGLADREFGHWMKIIQPGENFTAPKAVLSTCVGDVDELSWRLTYAQKEGRKKAPKIEKELPIVFNEFCTTWGNPTEENLLSIVEAIRDKGIKYCVIDAGWYSIGDGSWDGDMGDWDINRKRFPGGFGRTVEAIREAGMIPGLWFEMECVGQSAKGFQKTKWQLTRDNVPIRTGMRRFWDMRNPEVVEYLAEKLTGILKKYQFGYLKVDYNDNIGIGCDGAESLGEGLWQSVEASKDFFRKIRQLMPDLVIENCSSGGHRLEPSMQELTSMSSFSDAHECVHIPVVAANVHRAILPEQSQIWAVLRAADDEKRLYYSMANTLLGRMCLSGEIYDLTDRQWQIVEEGIAFYRKASPVIKDGKTKRLGAEELNYNRLRGWQALVRQGTREADGRALVVVHRFLEEDPAPNREDKNKGEWDCSIPLPSIDGNWKIADSYGRCQVRMRMEQDEEGFHLHLWNMEEMEAVAVLLMRESGK